MAVVGAPAFVAAALPQLVITTDGATSLFQYAAAYMGDALQAWRIADFNGGIDFWPGPGISLKIPKASSNNGGCPYN